LQKCASTCFQDLITVYTPEKNPFKHWKYRTCTRKMKKTLSGEFTHLWESSLFKYNKISSPLDLTKFRPICDLSGLLGRGGGLYCVSLQVFSTSNFKKSKLKCKLSIGLTNSFTTSFSSNLKYMFMKKVGTNLPFLCLWLSQLGLGTLHELLSHVFEN